MRDPVERSASLALRDGGPAPVRRAVDWYRRHGRLHTGDQIAMAHDALHAYHADVAAGKDALLICDTKEMADALNRRIHHHTITTDAPTVTAARGQRIAVGDLIISRRNEPAVTVEATRNVPAADPVRNGQRWRVYAIDPDHNRIAARRLDDGAPAAFFGDYLRAHISHGYAVTVHSAQGVTADTTHAVLGENTTRRLLYVALTRGRESNQAYLCERIAGEGEHNIPSQIPVCTWPAAAPATTPPNSCAASSPPTTTSKPTPPTIAAQTEDREQLPDRVQSLLERRARAVATRRNHYQAWCRQASDRAIDRQLSRDQHLSRSRDQGLDYGIDL